MRQSHNVFTNPDETDFTEDSKKIDIPVPALHGMAAIHPEIINAEVLASLQQQVPARTAA